MTWFRVTVQLTNPDETLDLYIEDHTAANAEQTAHRNMHHPQSPYKHRVVAYTTHTITPK